MEVTGNSRKDYLKSLVKSACSQTNASNLCQKCNWSGLAAGGRYLWQARIYRKKYLYSSTLIYFLTFERFVFFHSKRFIQNPGVNNWLPGFWESAPRVKILNLGAGSQSKDFELGSRLPELRFWPWESAPRIKILNLGVGSQSKDFDLGSRLPGSSIFLLLWQTWIYRPLASLLLNWFRSY